MVNNALLFKIQQKLKKKTLFQLSCIKMSFIVQKPGKSDLAPLLHWAIGI